MESIYHLRDDTKSVEQMQVRSREVGEIGLKTTHGLIGSPEWWLNIENGILALRSISGFVSGFWPGQWGDGPAEFEITQKDGTKSTWLCNVEPMKAKASFSIGRKIELDYVIQELKTSFNGKPETNLCIAIRLA